MCSPSVQHPDALPPHGGKTKSSPARIPPHEIDKLLELQKKSSNSDACRFYNSSVGCAQGSGCRWKRKRFECGGPLSWAQAHSE